MNPTRATDLPKPLRQYPRARVSGYTMVELVLVIVIIGILGSIAGPRFFDNTAFNERAYADELAASLRYAQKVAVASGCRVRVDITVATYSLTQQTPQAGHCDPSASAFPVQVRLSTGDMMNGSAPAGVASAPAISIVFDALGRTDLGANQILNIGSRTVSIEAESGLVRTP